MQYLKILFEKIKNIILNPIIIFLILFIIIFEQTVNISSIRSAFESQVESIFHRQIDFDRIYVSLNFHGLYIGVNNLSIIDLDKTVFMKSKKAQIGVRLMPLLKGKVDIKFLKFSNVKLNCVRINNKLWNFSDLLQVKSYANYLELNNLDVNFHDQESNNSPTHFKDFKFTKCLFHYSLKGKFENPKELSYFINFKLIQNSQYFGDFSSSGEIKPILYCNNFISDANEKSFKILYKAIINLPIPYQNLSLNSIRYIYNPKYLRFKIKSLGFILDNTTNTIKTKLQLNLKELYCNAIEFDKFNLNNFKLNDLKIISNIELEKDKLINIKKLVVETANTHLDIASKFTYNNLANIEPQSLYINANFINLNDFSHLSVNGIKNFESIISNFKNSNIIIKKSDNSPYQILLSINKLNKNIVVNLLNNISIVNDLESNFENIKLNLSTINFTKLIISDLRFKLANSEFISNGNYDLANHQGEILTSIKNFNIKNIRNIIKTISPSISKNIEIKEGIINSKLIINVAKNRFYYKSNTKLNNVNITLNSTPLKIIAGIINTDNSKIYFRNLNCLYDNSELFVNATTDISKQDVESANITCKNLNADIFNIMQSNFFNIKSSTSDFTFSGHLHNLELEYAHNIGIKKLFLNPENLTILLKPTGLIYNIKTGDISVNNNILNLENITIQHKATNININCKSNINKFKFILQSADAKINNLQLEDIYRLLNIPQIKQLVNINSIEYFAFKMISGTINGHINYNQANNITGSLAFNNLILKNKQCNNSFALNQLHCDISSDKIAFDNNKTNYLDSQFHFKGQCSHWKTNDFKLSVLLNGHILANNLLQIQNMLNQTLNKKIDFCSNLLMNKDNSSYIETTFDSWLTKDSFSSNFAINIPKHQQFTIKNPRFEIVIPSDDGIVLNGKLTQSGNLIAIKKMQTQIGNSNFIVDLEYMQPKLSDSQSLSNNEGLMKNAPIKLNVITRDYIKLSSIAELFKINNSKLNDLDCIVKPQIKLSGSIDSPNIDLILQCKNLSIKTNPLLVKKIKVNLSGKLSILQSFISGNTVDSSIANQSVIGLCTLNDITFNDIVINSANIPFDITSVNNILKLRSNEIKVNLFDGSAILDTDIYPNINMAKGNININDISMINISEKLFGTGSKITGQLYANSKFTYTYNNESSLYGKGQITVLNGSINQMSTLATKINQANLLESGILGFNFNNLLQSVAPIKSSDFSKIVIYFDVKNNNVNISKFFYNGDDIIMFGTGQYNSLSKNIDLKVIGYVPKSNKSIFGTTLGKLFNDLTPNKIIDIFTLGTLDKMPYLPIIGEIGNRPQYFTFRLTGPLDNTNSLSKSIANSFHWLTNSGK